jgi:hypothetical protein
MASHVTHVDAGTCIDFGCPSGEVCAVPCTGFDGGAVYPGVGPTCFAVPASETLCTRSCMPGDLTCTCFDPCMPPKGPFGACDWSEIQGGTFYCFDP